MKFSTIAFLLAGVFVFVGVFIGLQTKEDLPSSLKNKEIQVVGGHELMEEYFKPFEKMIGDDLPGL